MLADPPRGYFREHEGIRGPSVSSTRRVIQPRATCIRSNGEGAGERGTEGPCHQVPPGTRGFVSTVKHTLKNTTGYCAAQRNTSAEGRGRGGEGERDDDIKTWRTWRRAPLPSAVRASASGSTVRERYSRVLGVDLPRGSLLILLSSFFHLVFFPSSLDRFPQRSRTFGGFPREAVFFSNDKHVSVSLFDFFFSQTRYSCLYSPSFF